jgi:hypothetical protein
VQLLHPLAAQGAGELLSLAGVQQVKKEDERSWIVQVKDEAVVPALAARLVALDAALLSLMPRQVSLEDIYFQLQRQNHHAQEEVQHEH